MLENTALNQAFQIDIIKISSFCFTTIPQVQFYVTDNKLHYLKFKSEGEYYFSSKIFYDVKTKEYSRYVASNKFGERSF